MPTHTTGGITGHYDINKANDKDDNTLRVRQKGEHFVDDISKSFCLTSIDGCIFIQIRLEIVPKGSHHGDVIMGAMAFQITSPWLFTQPFIQAQIKENIKVPRHWHLFKLHP